MTEQTVESAETKAERLDRELGELLQELRVMLPGVQVLFAFLLGLPFTARFDVLTELQRRVYFGSFVAAAVSTVLLVAPSAYHRIRFRQYDKEYLLRLGTRLTISGSLFLTASMAGSIFVVADVLFHRFAAALVAAAIVALVAGLWFVLPLVRRVGDD